MKPSDDKLDELLEQHAAEARDLRLSALPKKDEVPEHRFSRRFERSMKRLRAEQRRTPRANNILRYARRAAAIILILFGISGTVYAYRVGVIDIIIKKFQEFTEFHYVTDISAADAEFPEVSFGYLPEGMTEVKSERVRQDDYRYTYFEDSSGNFFYITEALIISESDYQKLIDTEDAFVQYFNIMGQTATFVEKNGDCTIVWTYENVCYTVYGNISSSELRKISSKIKLQ